MDGARLTYVAEKKIHALFWQLRQPRLKKIQFEEDEDEIDEDYSVKEKL